MSFCLPPAIVTGGDGKDKMIVAKIMAGLADLDAAGTEGTQAARAGFLEWVMTLEAGAVPRQAAQDALRGMGDAAGHGPAVAAFRAHIEAATRPCPAPHRRGGAAARRATLH